MQRHRRANLLKHRTEKKDRPRVEEDHTPEGWVPANQRSDFVDPMSRERRRSVGH